MNKKLEKLRDELNKMHCEEWSLPYGGPDAQSDWSCSFDEGFNAACEIFLPLLKEADEVLKFYACEFIVSGKNQPPGPTEARAVRERLKPFLGAERPDDRRE